MKSIYHTTFLLSLFCVNIVKKKQQRKSVGWSQFCFYFQYKFTIDENDLKKLEYNRQGERGKPISDIYSQKGRGKLCSKNQYNKILIWVDALQFFFVYLLMIMRSSHATIENRFLYFGLFRPDNAVVIVDYVPAYSPS